MGSIHAVCKGKILYAELQFRQRPKFEIHPRPAAFPLPMALVIEEVAASLISHQACHQVQLQALLYPWQCREQPDHHFGLLVALLVGPRRVPARLETAASR